MKRKEIETFELEITKFLDVKTPAEEITNIDNYSIGLDLYMPKIDDKFIRALNEANQELYAQRSMLQYLYFTKNPTTNKKRLIIKNHIQIPSGIGLNINNFHWVEVRSKSSNFKNGYTVVHGTVDMNYTYGVGVQMIKLFDFKDIILEEDQKIAQLVLHVAQPVGKIKEISEEEWNSNIEISYKRSVREGGFGSTGKF